MLEWLSLLWHNTHLQHLSEMFKIHPWLRLGASVQGNKTKRDTNGLCTGYKSVKKGKGCKMQKDINLIFPFPFPSFCLVVIVVAMTFALFSPSAFKIDFVLTNNVDYVKVQRINYSLFVEFLSLSSSLSHNQLLKRYFTFCNTWHNTHTHNRLLLYTLNLIDSFN